MKYLKVVFLILASVIIASCSGEKSSQSNRVVVGISADLESLNPLYAFTFDEGNITELLFLSLVKHKWDESEGYIKTEPMLAKEWEWNRDSTVLRIVIRNDVRWSDGIPCTVADVIFSLDVYSDPLVQSRALGLYENYHIDENGKIDTAKSFEKISDYELLIKFKPGSKPSLFDIDQPIIPKQGFKNVQREDFETAEFNRNPITNGPFQLKSWEPNQQIILTADAGSYLISGESVKEIAFKIIPEYNNRVLQLLNGEIDLMEEIKTEDVERIKNNGAVSIGLVNGRGYDYIGWNNIDPKGYMDSDEIKPNKFFGNKNVRIALTHALNRKEILDSYLLNYGELSTGPISSIFKRAFNNNVLPYEYNPGKAKVMLEEQGWKDTNDNGIIDKDGLEFKFTMVIPSGNPRRKYAATIFRNNLREIGVDVDVQFSEMGSFMDGLFNKSFDAWMVGWLTPIPINLGIQWYSDLSTTQVNFASFQNTEVDSLLDQLETTFTKEKFYSIHRQLHKKIHEMEPVTFLYWIDNIVAHNSRIKNVDVNPLGIIHNCWEWSVNQ